jgi:N4-gp56 family major capsid protein
MTDYNLGLYQYKHSGSSTGATKAIGQALDANTFDTAEAAADLVNPEIWDRRLRAYTEDSLGITSYAEVEQGLLGQAGDTYNVSIDVAPSPAQATAETDAVGIRSLDYNQVTYDPTEYTIGYAVSDKEARRAFFSIADNISKKIGYAFRINREDQAISTIEAGAGHTVFPNDVTAETDLSETDVMSYELLVDARRNLKESNFASVVTFVTPKQFSDLAKDPNFVEVDKAGTDETLRAGDIGRIHGTEIRESNRLTVDSTNSVESHTAIMIGETELGEASFGYCPKHLPEIRSDYEVLNRQQVFAGAEEFDMQVLRPDALALLITA